MRTHRRRFLAGIMGAALAGTRVRASRAVVSTKSLRFDHLHTGERLAVDYFVEGEYVPGALTAVNQLLRDFRTGDVHPIAPELLDILFELRSVTASTRAFEVISGYRSPATNAALRQRSEGVAAGSLHMKGLAIDMRLGDVPLAGLRRAALDLRRGGVGYYPASNFVHVDTGRVRAW